MEDRANVLRSMEICRFCLDEKGPFTNIYERDSRDGRQSIPLPLQIMACVAIEVFANDGMPQLICNNCRSQTIGAYNFKTTCKKSDDALKLFLATGNLVKPSGARAQRNQRVLFSETATSAKHSSGELDVKPLKKPKLEYIESSQMLDESSYSQQELFEQEMTLDGDGEGNGGGSQEENTEEDEEYDEESMINPILKVSQVQTDVFPCTLCERSFPLKQLLDLHVKNHGRERSFKCEECGRKFFTKYDLAKHFQTHNSNKPYTCVVCRKQFSRESLLHRHEKIHVDVPKYLCSHCDRTFLTREDLDLHAEKHKKKRPFQCRICKKGFVFKQGLERHELTHSDEKPHKCNYCEASFTSPIKLMRHITSHAGLRPYPCKLCGRTFLLSHHLTRHMRSHYANKSPTVEPVGQHKCDVCSMSFRRKDSLINHSAIHSMVNLKCVICYTSFQNAKQVKDHITTHLAGLPYPCDKCDYSFETQEQLEEHEIKHAEMEYEDQIEQEVNQEQEMGNYVMDEEDEEEEEDDENNVAEFTITNDTDDNPQVVRRVKKSKNYAQFLNDDFASDADDDEAAVPSEEPEQEEQRDDFQVKESIKPITRTEGTKVYGRKSTEKARLLPAETSRTDGIDNLDALSVTEAVKDLPCKQYFNMKIGDKTLRVQKLMMTKSEIETMARQGRIEVKGDALILKSQAKPREVPKQITIENIIDEPRPMVVKPAITKTYVKRSPAVVEAKPVEVPQVESEGNVG